MLRDLQEVPASVHPNGEDATGPFCRKGQVFAVARSRVETNPTRGQRIEKCGDDGPRLVPRRREMGRYVIVDSVYMLIFICLGIVVVDDSRRDALHETVQKIQDATTEGHY